MGWPQHAKVPVVKGCQFRFPKTLDDGEHGRIDETDCGVCVPIADDTNASKVSREQIFDLIGARLNIFE